MRMSLIEMLFNSGNYVIQSCWLSDKFCGTKFHCLFI